MRTFRRHAMSAVSSALFATAALLAAGGVSAAVAAVTATVHVHSQATVGGTGPVGPALLPTGQYINALAAPGATFQLLNTDLRPDTNGDAAGAMTTALSPDGNRLLVLTSGYNSGIMTTAGAPITAPYLDPATAKASAVTSKAWNWVFVFDVSGGKTPVALQHIQLPDTFAGIAWSPDGSTFYVSGGEDDRIYAFVRNGDTFAPAAPLFVLDHNSGGTLPKPSYDGGIAAKTLAGKKGLKFGAETAGVAVSADGKTLYAVNLQNDSISIVNIRSHAVSDFALFTPGTTVARGEYPFWITPHMNPASRTTDTLFVSSLRDGQVVAIASAGTAKYIDVGGEPGKMLLSADGRELYVANPDLDEIDDIDTASATLVRRISVMRPDYAFHGSQPNSLALSADGATLFATLGGENAVAVIDVKTGSVRGRIPTGWFPNSVTVSADGTKLYIVNTKSNAGPNPANRQTTPYGTATDPTYLNEYDYVLEKGGLETVPIPDSGSLAMLSAIVDANNNLGRPATDSMMAFLHTKITHVMYIQKENRTYDQVLGDLGEGNGEPRLALFGKTVTPNFHQLAETFVDLDNFYTSSDVSGDGWNWTEQGHANDYTQKYMPLNYSSHALTFDANGTVRDLNPAAPLTGSDPLDRERLTSILDPTGSSTYLPGDKDPSANAGADDDRPGVTGGYIWDSVLRAGLTVRHYGEYDDQTWYAANAPGYIPIVRDAFAKGVVQGYPLKLALKGRTDPYYRGWDLNEPDEYRFEEWDREFTSMTKNGACTMPNFEPMVLMMDHTGDFKTQAARLNTPDLEVSSNDHAVGEIVDAVSHSPCWSSTAIFVIEDDSQNGPDHVDAHRSPGFIVSPWVRRNSVVHTNYNTTSMLRTIEDILGVEPLGLQDATAEPMSDVFARTPNLRPYDVIIPGGLCAPPVDPALVPACSDPKAKKSQAYHPVHSGAWWQQLSQSNHLVWDRPDENDAALYNRLLWSGMTGDTSYPTVSSGESAAAPDADDAR